MRRFTPIFTSRPGTALPALTLIASALLLAGCASFAGIDTSAVPIATLSTGTVPKLAQADIHWPQAQWWANYGDAQLDQLLARALRNSPTLASAQARLVRAQAAAGLANANRAPQVNGALDATYGRFSENHQVPKPPLGKGGEYASQGRAAIDFSYDLDFWGKNAALMRAADAQVSAAQFDQAAAELALTTAIVRSYLQLAMQHDMQDILQAMQKQRSAIRELSRQRVASGLDTRVELLQSTSSEAALRGELVQWQTAQALTRLQLVALAGDMPDAAAALTRPQLSAMAMPVPASLPLDLLGRRPELAAQRARISAATGEAQSAQALFYPNINLAGVIGLQSIGLDRLLNSGSLMSSAGPAIRLPVFEAGRLRANYAIKTADIDAAISQYNQSVVAAAQDVGEQLARAAALAQEEDANRAALDAIEEAHRLAMLRYRGGLSPYLSALSVEGQLLAQRRAALELKSRRQDIQVSLIRALGGGFQAAPGRVARVAGNATHP